VSLSEEARKVAEAQEEFLSIKSFGDIEALVKKNTPFVEPEERLADAKAPMLPTQLWRDARTCFLCGQYVASVMLSGACLEIGIRQSLENFLERKLGETNSEVVAPLLNELDFRRAVEYCRSLACFGDPNSTQVYSKLHQCFDIRNNYSHAKLSSILKEMGKTPVHEVDPSGRITKSYPLRKQEYLAMLGVRIVKAKEEALEIMRISLDCLKAMFPQPAAPRAGE
jgi:hypothetical protein